MNRKYKSNSIKLDSSFFSKKHLNVRSSLQYYRHFLAAIFAIEEINRNLNILPNVTLGFHIHDSWANERKAISSIFSILTGSSDYVPNYKCTQNRIPSAFIGHLLSSVSNVMYQITSIYGFPQVSYGALDPAFSDRIRFPLFYRTVTSETAQYKVIIQLIKAFNWNWVGMIFSDDESHQKASEDMKNEIINNGICVEFFVRIGETDPKSYGFALETLRQSNASVVIVYSRTVVFLMFVLFFKNSTNVVWLMLSPLSTTSEKLFNYEHNGSFVVPFHQGNIPGLRDFLYKTNPSRFPKDPFTTAVWLKVFGCYEPALKPSFESYRVCNANDTLEQYGFYEGYFRSTYYMYIAVYAVAHALHAMYTDKTSGGNILHSDKTANYHMQTQLNNHLKKIHFRTESGDDIFFNDKGEGLVHFDIINVNVFCNGTVTTRHVGTFNSSQSPGLTIDKETILWAPNFNGLDVGVELNYGLCALLNLSYLNAQIPVSNCSASCLPGYRKAFVKGKQICCYECVQCSEGEISPLPDMENCMICSEDQWSNESRDKCIMRTIDFLSYIQPLGVALTTTVLVLSFCSAAVFCIFLKYKKSPIVKANNQELSYILLLFLILSFLCSLLFIGRPTKGACLLRQISFGIIFAICISSILGKTITVIIAFNATRPGSRLRNYVGTRVPKYILLLCTLPVIFICVLWTVISPPFPDYDTHSETGKIILQCNEGSSCAFYIMVGYIALLAFVSFFVAYLARKLPDIYNEAQYITFSMLLFCSVWISFILAYVSTKGKYLAAVEIFAILVSSAGLLCLIFIPKCYIIFFKHPQHPEELLLSLALLLLVLASAELLQEVLPAWEHLQVMVVVLPLYHPQPDPLGAIQLAMKDFHNASFQYKYNPTLALVEDFEDSVIYMMKMQQDLCNMFGFWYHLAKLT
ncbi:vomeronasal type-2 receptor 26 [Xenopus laevis]|uniref:Vomeronasal type-2 receptor 26 n=1 Tax=Xenopus laevis TaxID=8355 RepID=A0A8J1LL65_XENLA|nr:vomeronasal type-2 receptor 26 [Xenopus laevis]